MVKQRLRGLEASAQEVIRAPIPSAPSHFLFRGCYLYSSPEILNLF